MTEFSQLIAPNELTISLAIFIIGILLLIAFLGIKMRSAFTIFMLALIMIVLMLIIMVSLAFVWFWIIVMLAFLVSAISAIEYYMIG